VNLEELRALFQLLDDQDIAEFELEEENLKLRIRKGASPAVHAPQTAILAPLSPAVMPAGAPAAAQLLLATEAPPAAAGAAADEEAGLHIVKSPIVGTFYRSPDPTSAAFVSVGDKVRVGQVLCIIEAMKLMNEIEAEVAGEIVRVHHENGQPVQYGQPLFSVRPDR
jgi:acetyl-CoA carboxylase biotin carboxyl carrier protein